MVLFLISVVWRLARGTSNNGVFVRWCEDHACFSLLLTFVLFVSHLQCENEIGGGSSLIFPEEIVQVIRKLYPGDVKNYVPKSGKVRTFTLPVGVGRAKCYDTSCRGLSTRTNKQAGSSSGIICNIDVNNNKTEYYQKSSAQNFQNNLFEQALKYKILATAIYNDSPGGTPELKLGWNTPIPGSTMFPEQPSLTIT